MANKPLYPHVSKKREPLFPHVPQTAMSSATVTLILPVETKQAMLNLCRYAEGENVEFGMVLPIESNKIIAGPPVRGQPDHIEQLGLLLEEIDATGSPYGAFHTHPPQISEEELPRFSDRDLFVVLIYDYWLFTSVGTPYHNYAQVAAKRKMAGPELKRRLGNIIRFAPAMEMLGLSLFVNTPDEIVEFLERENLLEILADFMKAGGPVEGMPQYFKEYSIWLDDGKPSSIEVVRPGTLPEDQIRLLHTPGRRCIDG